jgi:hypothetical protein
MISSYARSEQTHELGGSMSKASPQTIETLLRGYFHGKDENRPHLLCTVFTPTATLQVINKANTIVFPAAAVELPLVIRRCRHRNRTGY